MSNIGKDKDDRKIGEYWEDVFCSMARERGWEAWPFQRKRGATFEFQGQRYICPDVWILKRGTKQFACEIKHKTPTQHLCYGFELYRAESLLKLQREYTNQFGRVTSLYVIHNWKLNGDKRSKINNPSHWVAQSLDVLDSLKIMSKSKTLYNGVVTENQIPICYYPVVLFQSITNFI